jgi:ATP phosphoribosyltransferase
MITLALSKGRIFEETLPLLRAAGIEVLEDPEKSRKLILATNQPDVRVLVVRATDVPTYVQYGGADLGITGKDTLLEHGSAGPVPAAGPADCQVPHQRGGALPDFDYASAVRQGSRLKVATKYVAIARDFFAAKGVHVDLIKLYGSMELAPLTGWPMPSWIWCPPATRSRPTTWSRSSTSWTSARAWWSTRPRSSSSRRRCGASSTPLPRPSGKKSTPLNRNDYEIGSCSRPSVNR